MREREREREGENEGERGKGTESDVVVGEDLKKKSCSGGREVKGRSTN